MSFNSDISIFLVYHKQSPLLSGDCFVPIQVGNGPDIPGVKIRDNTGDNIASKNPNYCELTAQYWIWKNARADYVGLCHYRRLPSFSHCAENEFFDFSESTKRKFGWTGKNIARLLKRHEILLPPDWQIFPPGERGNVMTPYEFHSIEHRKSDIDEAIRVIHDLTPEMDRFVHKALCNDTHQCFGNVCVMRKDLFDNYSEWLFKILFEIERRIQIPEDREQARVFGYLSERLLMVWLGWAKETLGVRPWFARSLPLGVFSETGSSNDAVHTAAAAPAIKPHDPVDSPALSVVVPVFNVEKYLPQCLCSICSQCLDDIEIICVDDGSTDSSPEILARYAAVDRRIRIVTQPNAGLGAARNRGITEANGKYLAFVDSDDWIDRLAWYRSIRKAERLDLDMLIFDTQPVDDVSGRYLNIPGVKTEFSSACYIGAFTWRDIGRSPFNTPCYAHGKILKRSFWGNRRFPEGMLYEDAQVHFDLLLSAQRIGALACPYDFYRIRGGSLMTKKGAATLDHLRIIPPVWNRICSLGLQEELGDSFAAYVQDIILRCRNDWPEKECRLAISKWFQEKPQSEWQNWPMRRIQAFRLKLLAEDSPLCMIIFPVQQMLAKIITQCRTSAQTVCILCGMRK